MDILLRLWDVKNNRVSVKSVDAQSINLAVDKIRVEVNSRYQELMQADGYVTAAKLKEAATTAAANIAESVGSLFGSNKVKTLDMENPPYIVK